MTEINEAATVSRTIMKVETCRVVLFPFDKDRALNKHTAVVPAAVQAPEEWFRIDVDGQSVEFVPGDILHLGTHLPHAVFVLESNKILSLMSDPDGEGGKKEERPPVRKDLDPIRPPVLHRGIRAGANR